MLAQTRIDGGDALFGMPRPDNLPARRRDECYTMTDAR